MTPLHILLRPIPPIRATVHLAVATVLALGPAVAWADDDERLPDLAGVYLCEGMATSGAAYRGFVHIVPRDDVYVVQWSFSDGDVYAGIGVVNGSAFAVTYVGERSGVAAYTIESAARLVGTWTVEGADGQAFPETLTKLIGIVQEPRDETPAPRRDPDPPPSSPRSPPRGGIEA